jgi:hypothetical protein
MSKKQEELSQELDRNLIQIQNSRVVFDKELNKSLREKLTEMRFKKIKEVVIDRTENILTQLLTKLKESR